MLEECLSETARLMALAADCRATVERTRAILDHSWSFLQDVEQPLDGGPIFSANLAEALPFWREPSSGRSSIIAPAAIAPLAPSPNSARPFIANRLLRSLPPECCDLILSKAKRVKLKKGQVLEQPRVPVAFAYFVESGIVSLQAVGKGGGLLAFGLVGSDGMTGLPIVLRSMTTPLKVQTLISGEAWRISAADLQSCLDRSSALLDLLLSYVQAMLVQSAYVGLCGARHTARQRIRSWLLLAAAALGQDQIATTHQFVARLLGLRRATVSDCLAELQRSKAIAQRRGCVVILDAEQIAEEACECHRIVAAEFRHLWSGRLSRSPAVPASSGDRASFLSNEEATRSAAHS